jgi:hypothetical protein
MEGKEVTVCLTSCNRWDLLDQTLRTLIKSWSSPVPKSILIHEDWDLSLEAVSIFWQGLNRLKREEDPTFPDIELTWGKMGQIKAIDHLYSKVQTPYIFHCEDDWTFHRTGFIEKSLDILESDPKISNVWIRNPNDRNGHPAFGGIRKANGGTRYQLMSPNFAKGKFRGFSFNPGLRRLSDYQLIGPYSKITTFDPKQPLRSEIAVGQAYYRHGFRACTLPEGYCTHSGNNRHCQ